MSRIDKTIADTDRFLAAPQNDTWRACVKLLFQTNSCQSSYIILDRDYSGVVHPRHPAILTRLAQVFIQGDKLPKLSRKKAGALAAVKFATEATELDPDNVITHRTLAMAWINLEKYVFPENLFATFRGMRAALERAIQLDADDATYHFHLGQCLLKVAKLSWLDFVVGNTLGGIELAPATYDDALECFEQVDALNASANRDNAYFIAETLVHLKRMDQAKAWLAKALNMPANVSDEKNKEFNDMAWALAKSFY
ncbi:Aste57867_12287 [Aphanomyces stellatus]|uniref:Regulator of microtubule dynamics protein 1 n=1 Tax=Aphanomyces stellatus TaxID=120398 RepID=A0A485KV75_9STRA|nr:hypothetical protein As57867_012242 [Aphanomyces stellatus]VFT89140.1 Aste57867_12287 [Aphanomyces stellatus]